MLKKCSFLCLMFLLLTGCVEKEILDDISIESGLGFDYYKEGQILGTALVPNYMPDKSIKNVTYTSVSAMNRELFLEMQRQSADPLVIGSLQVALFGEKLAKNGIIDLIDSLQRDATIGERLYLVVVDGKASELLKHDYGTSGNATYISNLIEQNIKSRDLPKSNLHRFIYDFFQTGKDSYLPTVKKIGKDKMEINGISLFKKDKVVETLPTSKMFFFKLLVDQYSEGTYKIKMGDEEAAVRSILSRTHFALSKKNPTEVTIRIKIKGSIREFSGNKLSPKAIKTIEKNMEKTVNQQSLKLLNHFKEIGIDPVGIGHFVKSRTRHFDYEKWKTTYKTVPIKVKTKVEIIDAGVIE